MTFRLELFLHDNKAWKKKSIWKHVKPVANSVKILVRIIIWCLEEQKQKLFL